LSYSPSSPPPPDSIRRYAESFIKQYDKNGNGQLDKEELSEMKPLYRAMYRVADKNQDGIITLDEFIERLVQSTQNIPKQFIISRYGIETLTDSRAGQYDSYALDSTANPKRIDAIGAFDNMKSYGIYELQGDRLTLCNSLDKQPTELSASPDNALTVLKRVTDSTEKSPRQENTALKPTEIPKGSGIGERAAKGKETNEASRKIRFKISFQPWKAVLPWFADQAGLSLMMDAPPPGTFNYTADKEYTVDEAIDLLNWVLMAKGYKLVRHEQLLMVVELEKAVRAPNSPSGGTSTIEPLFKFDFKTTNITRDDIMETVSANGTIEPAEVVDVSAQVSGRIVSFGDDPRGTSDPQFKGKLIDYNSPVEEGTVLARIDDALYKSRVEQEKAAERRTQIEYSQAKAKAEIAESEWQRVQDLYKNKNISTSDYDLAKTNYTLAQAATITALATMQQSKATLEQAQINLNNTVIKSPINGSIVARRLNIGQNVGPDPNAPSLFLIAKDLKNMQVWASVDEGDIGRIRDRMTASFIVDAFPKEKFMSKVIQIRKDAIRTQNAVTYTVILAFDNSDIKLMPYLTANIKFEVDARKHVLLVPNAALRWKPSAEMMAKGGPVQIEKLEGLDVTIVHGDKDAVQNTIIALSNLSTALAEQKRGIIWVKSQDDKHVRPIEVQTGLTDGRMTEISGPDVNEGMEVVIGHTLKVGADIGPTINHFSPDDSTQPAKVTAKIEKPDGKPVKSVFLGGWSVNDADLEHLQGLGQLESLNLANANVTDAGLERLKGATQLQSLNLTFTKVTDAGVEHIKGLTNLQSLSLHGIGVTDAGVERLKTLTNLRELSLYNTAITDAGLEHLKGLTKLQSLDLGANKITGAGLKHISGLTELQSLNLIWTQLTDAGLDYLEGLNKLQSLNLWSTKVTDVGMEHLKGLTQLQSLELGRSKVTDACLEHLQGLTQLQSLGLAETKVTDEGVKKLQKALPNCKIEGKNARVEADSREKR
jgi:HlyD family secretion protein